MPARKKLRVGVVFGGRSVEHQVSVVSAASVIGALDRRKFQVVPIGITPSGKWFVGKGALRFLREGGRRGDLTEVVLLPDSSARGLAAFTPGGKTRRPVSLDVIFPVLHGSPGEDGTMQGLFELSGIPYVGAGVLASAAGMDKAVTKLLWEREDLPVLPFIHFGFGEFRRNPGSFLRAAERRFGYPCFVKPVNSGSSIGISKAHGRKELRSAVDRAFRYDARVLIEKGIDRAREIEVAVMGNDQPEASVPGEILPSNEFYDYNAKYVDDASRPLIPAPLPAGLSAEIRRTALRAYRAVACEGMARVDFLLHPRSKKFYLSEINTIPGFTSISMFPKLWQASGIVYTDLLTRLIRMALARHRSRAGLRRYFDPGTSWFR